MRISTVKLGLILSVLFGGSFSAAAQMTTDIAQVVNDVSKEHRVVRRVPEKFHITRNKLYSWVYGYHWVRDTTKHQWKRWAKTGVAGLLLQSDDRQCELLYSDFLEGRNHRTRLQNDLLNISQGRDSIRFEDHVLAVGGRKVKRRFNADSIFVLKLPIEPQELAGETYTRCAMLYLSRKDRAYLGFTFLFTDEGYERRAEYLRALDGAVRYKRGEPKWMIRRKKAQND